MAANLENSTVATGLEKVSFHSNPKEQQWQKVFRLHSSYTLGKVMLKILQDRLQQYMNQEFPFVQVGFRKGRWTGDQIASIHWVIKKARELKKKKIYFCFIDDCKAFDCVDHDKLWKILTEMGIPNHLTCLLRNLYVSQEARVRTTMGHWTVCKLGKK